MTVTDGKRSTEERDGKDKNDGPLLTHTQCVNELRNIQEQMSQLAGLDKPSEEDDRYFAELRDKFDEIDAHRKDLERKAELARITSAAEGLSSSRHLRTERGAYGGGAGGGYDRDAFLEPDSIEESRYRNPWDLSEVRTFGRSPDEVNGELRSRALCAISKMQSCNDAIREAGTTIVERFDDKDAKLSRMVLLTSSPEYLRGFAKAATNRQHEVTESEQRALSEVRALSLTDSAGGYLVKVAS